MSLRDKAREVKEAGIANRGNFTPHGVPLNIYKYWLENATGKKASAIRKGTRKENLCHYVRVVVFWAPLLKIVNLSITAAPFAGILVVLAAIVAFIWGLIASPSMLIFVLQMLVVLVAVVVLAGGILGGITLGMDKERRAREQMPPLKMAIPFALVGLPVGILAFVITKLFLFYCDHLRAYDKQFLIGTAAVLVGIGTFGVGLTSGWLNVLWGALFLAGGVTTGFLLLLGGSYLADYISGKRSLAKIRALNAREEFYNEHGKFPEDVYTEPGRLQRFFSGIADFIVLLGQRARAKKWQICPFVEITNEVDN